jgi:predicted transport protein
VQKALGNDIEVDWSDIRVICIAPNYKKYDLHAVQVMGANIELWKYRLFKNNTVYFEEVFQSSLPSPSAAYAGTEKNPVMVAAGKKAAQTRATASYTFDEHLEGKTKKIQEFIYTLREYILGLDTSIEEAPKKFYIAYKTSQNIVCMEVQTKKILLYLKLKPTDILTPPANFKDVSNIGHYGTGDVEFSIKSEEDIEITKPFIELAYQKVGS